MCLKKVTCGPGEKERNLCVKPAVCPNQPSRHSYLKFCVRRRVREAVIFFKLHEMRLRGLGAVMGRKSPSIVDLAHRLYNSLYHRAIRDRKSGDKLHTDMSSYMKICIRTHLCKQKSCIAPRLFTVNTFHSAYAQAITMGNFYSDTSSYVSSCTGTRPCKSVVVQRRVSLE